MEKRMSRKTVRKNMNPRPISRDILAEQYNMRELLEPLYRVINEMTSAAANAKPQIREVVSKLHDQNKNKQANALATDFQEILNRIHNLTELGNLLRTQATCGSSQFQDAA